MHLPSRPSRCLCVALLLAAAPRALPAQAGGGDLVAHATKPIAAWMSVGLGAGDVAGARSGAVAGMLRANVTVGPLLVMYRNGGVGPFMSSGDGVDDNAYLVGARTPGHRLFAAAALGYDRATRYHECFEGCTRSADASATSSLAWDLSVHANELVPGLVLSYAGTVGAARVRYSAFTLGAELGWFGR